MIQHRMELHGKSNCVSSSTKRARFLRVNFRISIERVIMIIVLNETPVLHFGSLPWLWRLERTSGLDTDLNGGILRRNCSSRKLGSKKHRTCMSCRFVRTGLNAPLPGADVVAPSSSVTSENWVRCESYYAQNSGVIQDGPKKWRKQKGPSSLINACNWDIPPKGCHAGRHLVSNFTYNF